MSKPNLQSTAAPLAAPQPLRHGASWGKDEVEKLIEEIQQGLALSELADRHQRTPTSITRAVLRLIPPPIRPDSELQSMEVLARYLSEHSDVDRQQLIADFWSARTASARPRPSESPRCSVAQGIAAKTAEEGFSTADVGMLVAVAVTCLPRNRDSEVLEMRLGVDGQPLTLAEIGKQYRLSRERVRQIQERGLRKLARQARDESSPGHILKSLLEPLRQDNQALAAWVLDAASSGFEILPRIAAKFILHAAGYTKARTAEIIALLSASEFNRDTRSTESSCAKAEKSTQSSVGKWLEHSEWPAVVAQPPSAEQLAAQRTVGESGIAGNFHSCKLGRTVHYESRLEYDVLTALERSEQIAYYQEQPAQIPYVFQGRKRTYFPDVFAATADGRGLLIEVKPTNNMALSISRAKADAGRAWAHAHGWGWLVVNNRYTFHEVERHIITKANRDFLEGELRNCGTLTWRNLLSLRCGRNLTRLDFTAYIVQSGAHLDRSYRVTACDKSSQ